MDAGDFDLHLPRSRPWAADEDRPFSGLIPTGGEDHRQRYDKRKKRKKRVKKET